MSYYKKDDWKCHCGTLNFASRDKCYKCDDFKSKTDAMRSRGDWNCLSCHELNFATRSNCRKCSVVRDGLDNSGLSTQLSGSIKPKPGDWNCPSCQELNFATRLSCRKCSKVKDSSDILVQNNNTPPKPGDWRCTKCNNLDWNFSSRLNCRTCGAPKDLIIANNPINNPANDFVNNPINAIINNSDNKECKICCERPISVVFTTCGHVVSCNVCCHAMDKCPLCRVPYKENQILNIFMG